MDNDNSQPFEWPLCTIIKATDVSKSIWDQEPYQQKLELSCGHWLFNTHGNKFPEHKAGENLRCKTCYLQAQR